jgi:HEAT repeat protein
MNRLTSADISAALEDPDPAVRRRGCDLSPGTGDEIVPGVIAALGDVDALVVEAACAALGERGVTAGRAAVTALAHVATDHGDALCREAAVAALGAIEDPSGLAAIVTATSDKPAVRRRAVLALAPFSGPEVDAALQRARSDRDWQVRQAAVDLLTD